MRKEKQKSQYSVISTEIITEKTKERELLVKLYRCNIELPITLLQLKAMIDEYRIDISAAGINTPEIIDSAISADAIRYTTENCGSNLIELGFSFETFGRFIPQINQILDQLTIAVNSKLMIDPHPKNFVFGNGEAYFVDIFPPYSVQYNEIRNSIATPKAQVV